MAGVHSDVGARGPIVPDTALYRMLADFAESSGMSLQDPALGEALGAALVPQLETAAANPIVGYGVHTEAMFEWLVGGLGANPLIQPLDGPRQAVVNGDSVSAPDFLLVTPDGSRIAVEVKNCAAKTNRRKFKREYLLRIKRYADTLSATPMIAIYWTNLDTWTLLDIDFLLSRSDVENLSISFVDALAESEMYRLGDVWVFLTAHPFRFRMDFRVQDESSVGEGRITLGMVVEDVTMSLGATRFREGIDSQVLWYLALHGLRLSGGDTVYRDSPQTAHIEFSTEGEPDAVSDGLLQAGPLSSMLSRQYRSASCDDEGMIARLSAARLDSEHACRLLAAGYQGEEVGFVYLTVHPRRMGEGNSVEGD